MSGYSASGHIGPVRVHAIAHDRGRREIEPSPTRVVAEAADARVEPHDDEPGRLEALLADLRTSWRQTTFYLFDADSWR